MEFQNQGHKITQSVFEKCGTVRTAKREAFSEDIGFEDQIPDEAKIANIKDFSTAKDLVKANSRRSDFDKLVNEVRFFVIFQFFLIFGILNIFGDFY